MATLGKIRNRSGLLLAVIGIAMLAFILGDFMQSKRVGGNGSIVIGEVSGDEILIQDFQEKVDEGIENYFRSCAPLASFYREVENSVLTEEKGRSRQRGIYKSSLQKGGVRRQRRKLSKKKQNLSKKKKK